MNFSFHADAEAVIYQVKPGAIRIYAVAHLNRLPGYWKSRERDRDPST